MDYRRDKYKEGSGGTNRWGNLQMGELVQILGCLRGVKGVVGSRMLAESLYRVSLVLGC